MPALSRTLLSLGLGVVGALTLAAGPAFALKYAPVVHHLAVDAAIPAWHPGELEIRPEEDFHLVGADVMDEMTLGWVKLFRRAYPRLSVTMEARASGSGAPALIDGRADAAPVGRELLPAELKAFEDKFGYAPLAIRVATGSVGTLGKTASSVIFVNKDNPIRCLTLAELDAIYSTTRKRGHAPVGTWGDLGLQGDWATLPLHLYGLKPPNGIEWYFKLNVLEGGQYKGGIQYVKSAGFTHAFTIAAHDIGTDRGGITYAMLANRTPEVRVVPLAEQAGAACVAPTLRNVYLHRYPLSRYVYIYVNRQPGRPLAPAVREFLRLVLSRQGQEQVAHDGVYLPLTPAIVRQERAKLD